MVALGAVLPRDIQESPMQTRTLLAALTAAAIAAVVTLVLSVGVIASWVPAKRAVAIDPASALRSE